MIEAALVALAEDLEQRVRTRRRSRWALSSALGDGGSLEELAGTVAYARLIRENQIRGHEELGGAT